MKVAVITCYKQPDYIRAVVLRRAVAACPGVELLVVKNKRHRGVLRYFEVALRLLWLRLRHRPDVYIQTFRGYETLPLVLLLAGRKPVILDELINPLLVVEEHRRMYAGKATHHLMRLWSVLGSFYRFLLRRCCFILADTPQHAEYSATLSRIPQEKYVVVPVGADEDLIKPAVSRKFPQQPFTVLYYGNTLPLHGLPTIIEATLLLKNQPIQFVIYGGSSLTKPLQQAIQEGARLTHHPEFVFRELSSDIAQADLCLGGPFGDTVQAKLVITGKTFQYMAGGKPAVVGRTPATRVVFKDKQNCLLVDLASPKSLARAIEWAADHPKQLQRIAALGQKLYHQQFSQAVVQHKIADLLKRLV